MHFIPSRLFVLLFTLSTSALWAQTPTTAPKPMLYGHMNLGNFLESLPETKNAADVLKVYADSLATVGDTLSARLEREASKFQKQYENRELTQIQAQERYQALQKQEGELQAFDQKAQELVAQRRAALLNPILLRIEEAVKAIAKEYGYLMIFDTSGGHMLFALESEDVSELVKKKMGVE